MGFNKKLFGKTLKLHRNDNSHTLDALSIMTGISVATLHRYEKATTDPNIDNVMTLCHDYLKVPSDTFTESNTLNAHDILSYKVPHTFASIAQHLNLYELVCLARLLRRYQNIVTLFDAIKDVSKFYNQINEEIGKEI